MHSERVPWRRKAVGWAAIAVLVGVALHFFGPVAQVLLFAFGGIVLGVFLDGVARRLHQHLRVRRGVALVGVLACLLGALVGAVVLVAPVVVEEGRRLVQTLPSALGDARDAVERTPLGPAVASALESARSPSGLGDIARGMTGIVGGALGALLGIALIVFVGITYAAEPETYAENALRLVPIHRRGRWREVFGGLRDTLFYWVLGRLANMIIIGALTSVGLFAIGVPAPLALGLLAGVLTFVPNFGPLLSVVPAALLALAKSPTTLLWVFALYAGAQLLESYVVTPLIQRRAVAVPPALLVTAQVVLGVPLGALGLLLATPIVGIAVTLLRAFYVEDTLGDRPPTTQARRTDGEERAERGETEGAAIRGAAT